MQLKRIAAISALTLMLATGAAKAKTPEVSSIASKIDASSLSKVVPVDDVSNEKPNPSIPVDQANRNAMTWKMKQAPVVIGSKTYVLFGSDNGQPGGTNPYNGDTSVNEYRSLLCINKTGAPAPEGLPSSSITPGGANNNSWSGGTVLVIPNIQGKQLTSQAVADNMCAQVGKITRGISGYRMAEFHDGNGSNPGWSFWAEAYGDINGLASSTRYWVNINDQPGATPWAN
jgi:hypothetical protein